MLSTNLVVFKPLANGRCSATVIPSGVVQGVFSHVTSSQRAAGLDSHVKTFWGLTNTDNFPLLDPEAYHDKPTLSPDDFVVMWLSTQRTVQAGLAAEALRDVMDSGAMVPFIYHSNTVEGKIPMGGIDVVPIGNRTDPREDHPYVGTVSVIIRV